MARGNFSTDTASFAGTTVNVSAEPFTMAVWFYPLALQNTIMMAVGDSATEFHDLRVSSAGVVQAVSINASGYSSNVGTYAANGWYHACGVWSASNSRTAYLNGTAGTTNTNNVAVSPLDQIAVGGSYAGAPYFNGYLAEAAIWNVALTAAEITSLSKGFAARLIRPASLVHYMPLIRSDVGPIGAIPSTGSIGAFPHPPIIGAIAA